MASDNVIIAIKVIDGGNMSGNLVSSVFANGQPSSAAQVSFLDNIGFQFIWTGAPTGIITIKASLDGTTFTPLVLAPAITQPAGSAGNDIANINQFPFKWIQVTYTRTSGAGSLTVWMSAKEV